MSERSSSQAEPSVTREAVSEQALALVEHLQAELDGLREQLIASNRLGQLGMLTAALAHETNNRLTPIRSYAQLALANLDDPPAVERALRAAVEGTKKIEQLTEHMIGLASPSRAIETSDCDCRDAVQSAIEAMTPLIDRHGVRVIEQVDAASVQIEGLVLEQVLINLIANACHAMQDRPGRREIRIVSERGETRLVLSVCDTGPGVPESLRDRLFDAFATGKAHLESSSNDEPVSGSGLGLCICRQLVEAAGGSIILAETSERGSSFRIELPIDSEPPIASITTKFNTVRDNCR